jgi:hypothetical protein
MVGNYGPQLNGKIQFAFYAAALLCFLAGSVLPVKADGSRWSRVNLIALGLAFGIAPSAYIYFKLGFHTTTFFH